MRTLNIQKTIICVLILLIISAALRFFALSWPHELVFDETYYVKDAWALMQSGAERQWPPSEQEKKNTTDVKFASGDVNIFKPNGSFIVHPQIGRWMIALGIKLSEIAGRGITYSDSWRTGAAVAGTLAVIILYFVAFELTGSIFLSFITAFLFSIDGLAIVMSRTGLIDIFLMFYVLLGALFFLFDYRKTYKDESCKTKRIRVFRFLGVVSVSLGCCIKWSAIYYFALFLFLSLLADFIYTGLPLIKMAQTAKIKTDNKKRKKYDASKTNEKIVHHFACIVFNGLKYVLLLLVIYIAGWFSWFATPDSWGRSGDNSIPAIAHDFIAYHGQMWGFHTRLKLATSPAPYSADASGWLIQKRPTAFYWDKVKKNNVDIAQTILSLGNPFTWWLSTGSLVFLTGFIFYKIFKKKKIPLSMLIPVLSVLSGWLPWVLFYTERPIFHFYSIIFLPWFILCLTTTVSFLYKKVLLLGNERIFLLARSLIVLGVIMIIAATVFFYPIWSAWPIKYSDWYARMWFKSWI